MIEIFFKELFGKQLAMLDQEVREEWQKVDVRDTNGLGGRLPFLKYVDREEMEGGGGESA